VLVLGLWVRVRVRDPYGKKRLSMKGWGTKCQEVLTSMSATRLYCSNDTSTVNEVFDDADKKTTCCSRTFVIDRAVSIT